MSECLTDGIAMGIAITVIGALCICLIVWIGKLINQIYDNEQSIDSLNQYKYSCLTTDSVLIIDIQQRLQQIEALHRKNKGGKK